MARRSPIHREQSINRLISAWELQGRHTWPIELIEDRLGHFRRFGRWRDGVHEPAFDRVMQSGGVSYHDRDRTVGTALGAHAGDLFFAGRPPCSPRSEPETMTDVTSSVSALNAGHRAYGRTSIQSTIKRGASSVVASGAVPVKCTPTIKLRMLNIGSSAMGPVIVATARPSRR